MVGKAFLREDKNFHSSRNDWVVNGMIAQTIISRIDNSSVSIADGCYPTERIYGSLGQGQMFECRCFLVNGVVPSASTLEFESRDEAQASDS